MISLGKNERRCLWLGLVLLALGATAILLLDPGFYTVDENHHFTAARTLLHGQLEVPEYEGLPDSLELAHFDPDPHSRPVELKSTRVPPLYSFLAAPFLFLFGLKGLYFLNLLAFVGILTLVFFWTRRRVDQVWVAWLVVGLCILGGYQLEYALGLWPHMLSAFLCLAGLFLLARRRGNGRAWLVYGAGLLLGLAAGVRYQNILVLGFAGVGLAIWHKRRWLDSGLFLLGALGPLLASSLLNFLALGSFNPISKGGNYLSLGASRGVFRVLGDSLQNVWFRVVDFSTRPALESGSYDWDRVLPKNPATGAFWVAGGGLKKAWLQSAPWILLALVFLGLAWWAVLRRRQVASEAEGQRRQDVLSLSLVLAGVLAAFAVQNPNRTDGLCYNQRYLIDLVPLLALVLAWGLSELRPRWSLLGAGLVVGALLATLPLLAWQETDAIRQLFIMKLPLVLAGLLLIAWLLRHGSSGSAATWVALGLCVGWALVLHLGDDLSSSMELRAINRQVTREARAFLPQTPTAVITSYKEGFAPLQLEGDLVIVTPWPDGSRDTVRLVKALLGQGRRVFFFKPGIPKELAMNVLGVDNWRMRNPGHPHFREIIKAGRSQ